MKEKNVNGRGSVKVYTLTTRKYKFKVNLQVNAVTPTHHDSVNYVVISRCL